MTTSTFKICISEHFRLATRPNGVEALLFISDALVTHEVLELDFSGANPTPSFADECLGGLCKSLGLTAYKRRVKLTNVADEVKPLIRRVVLTRAAESVH